MRPTGTGIVSAPFGKTRHLTKAADSVQPKAARLNHESLSCDNGFAVGGAHEGLEALASEGCAGRLAAEHVERDAVDRGEVARRMVFAGAATAGPATRRERRGGCARIGLRPCRSRGSPADLKDPDWAGPESRDRGHRDRDWRRDGPRRAGH